MTAHAQHLRFPVFVSPYAARFLAVVSRYAAIYALWRHGRMLHAARALYARATRRRAFARALHAHGISAAAARWRVLRSCTFLFNTPHTGMYLLLQE